MAYLGKEYKFVSEENFEGFLKAIDIPAELIAKFRHFKPTSKLEKIGDTYVHTFTTPNGTKVVQFSSGVEFEDTVHGVLPVKATCVVDGNTVTQTIKSDKVQGTFKREYNGDTMKVTITSDKWDGVAYRYYKS